MSVEKPVVVCAAHWVSSTSLITTSMRSSSCVPPTRKRTSHLSVVCTTVLNVWSAKLVTSLVAIGVQAFSPRGDVSMMIVCEMSVTACIPQLLPCPVSASVRPDFRIHSSMLLRFSNPSASNVTIAVEYALNSLSPG